MSIRRKDQPKSIVLAVPTAAAGSAADVSAIYTYNAFANSATTATSGVGIDPALEYLLEISVTTDANHTGQATNYASIRVLHVDGAAATKNDIKVDFDAAGKTMTANKPMNFNVASAATVTNAGTATMTKTTGSTIPWTLAPGDSIMVKRLSNNATGNATPSISATLLIGVKA